MYYNDGAFAGLFQSFIPMSKQYGHFFHPQRYHYSVLLPWSFDLISNGLNILLGYERAVHFWEEGLRRCDIVF
jgi:hypothetical protein